MKHVMLRPLARAALLAGAACTLALAPPALAVRFTLDQVSSAPLISGLVAATTRNATAWISNDHGARNVWIAERGANGAVSARALTSYQGDDGIEMGALGWGGGGGALVYTRGGSEEGGGPVNTMSLASGPSVKEVWAVSASGGSPQKFGPGDEPVAAPAGNRIAFLRGGQIWLGEIGTDKPAVQLVADRGKAAELSWSPDGRKLAFISRRGTHNLLGLYDFDSGGIRWMSPSVDRDTAPTWSPDGKQIAWVRVAASSDDEYFAPKRAGEPWSLWVADVASGAARSIWRAKPGPGSVYHRMEDSRSLFWSANGRLIFPWEVTGWLRLYAIPAQGGGEPVALTGDGAETFAATLDPKGTALVYASNQSDDDHRHLWRVAVSGGTAAAITRGDSIEDFPVITPDGALFALRGTAHDPMAPAMIAAGKASALVAPDPHFPGSQLVAPQRVVFKSPDGLDVHGQLFVPSGAAAGGKRPALLFFHGGPQRQMLLGWHPMGAYARLYAMNQFLAAQGYIVLSVNYRGGTGYGLNFREADEFATAGGSEARDIVGAVQFLKGRGDVDTKRIGVYGMSYGGIMTSLALARQPGDFAVGVDMAGVHDWKSFLPQFTAPGASPAAADLAFRSSAMATVDQWRTPTLIVHADDDRAVPFAQSVELIEALRKSGKVEPEQFIIPNEVHDLIRYQSWMMMLDHVQAYLGRYLLPK
jgi:dipeptidyl aminopeptidase/acylaminoacyl peptidase